MSREQELLAVEGIANLHVEKIQIRKGRRVIAYLVGKGSHVRTIPMPRWVKEKLDRWTFAGTISTGGECFAPYASKNGTVWGDRINENVVWHVLNRRCRSIGLEQVAPHDLRTWIGGPGVAGAVDADRPRRLASVSLRFPVKDER